MFRTSVDIASVAVAALVSLPAASQAQYSSNYSSMGVSVQGNGYSYSSYSTPSSTTGYYHSQPRYNNYPVETRALVRPKANSKRSSRSSRARSAYRNNYYQNYNQRSYNNYPAYYNTGYSYPANHYGNYTYSSPSYGYGGY